VGSHSILRVKLLARVEKVPADELANLLDEPEAAAH